LIECVPNVSEGRDGAVIEALGSAVTATGAWLVDVHSDPDHHRSVFTFLGEPEAVERAALALAREVVARIDVRTHLGVHPRIGSLDVMPFVPLRGASMRAAVEIAWRVGRTLARDFELPVFFYGEAALVPARRELPAVRGRGYETLAERLSGPAWTPDAGPARAHPSAGAAIVGARPVLIAFNAVLATGDLAIARAIAGALRESSGGLPAVRAIGVTLASRGLTQVAMNLLDYRRTTPSVVSERLEEEAARAGTDVVEYELVGCAPADAFAELPRRPIARLRPSQLLDPSLFRS
jgi:glutamate formiminotransferase